jgi:hypothetical protein
LSPIAGVARFPYGLVYNLGAPFPSDQFTVPDKTQNTLRRISLPFSPCANPSPPTDPGCFGLYTISLLDGFNVQPRLSIPFSGPIDVSSVSSKDVFLVGLGSTLHDRTKPGQIVGINQVVWDVARNVLHVESNDLLEQHARYVLIVTNGIHDTSGNPIQASAAFRNFPIDFPSQKDPALKSYEGELALGLGAALLATRVLPKDVVVASIFTTESVTATLEKIRDQLKAQRPAAADFNIGPGGSRAVFSMNDVASVNFNLQSGVDASNPGSFELDDTGATFFLSPFPVGQLAYGRFSSPVYINSNVVIPAVGTLSGKPAVLSTSPLYFTLVVPSGTRPAKGWPVAIWGHGSGDSKDFSIPVIAGIMAKHGIATIGINAVGNGWGPAGTLRIQKNDLSVVEIPEGGRGVDQNGDGFFEPDEGHSQSGGPILAGTRDGDQQTVADMMQLVREIQIGIDIDGDGNPDLNPSRIYYFGLSLGGNHGTLFTAIEPAVHSAVLNGAGGPVIDIYRLEPDGVIFAYILSIQIPPLLNGGVPFGFTDNTPLRNQPPVINNVAGADAIQGLSDAAAWIDQAGEPVPYAEHLRKEPLSGVPAKSVVIQIAKGDKVAPNPTETALVRAGDLADRTTYFRNDILFNQTGDPVLAGGIDNYYPHLFIADFFDGPNTVKIATDTQEQIGTFFASDGATIINPDPSYFEVPIVPPLPEDLNYLFGP